MTHSGVELGKTGMTRALEGTNSIGTVGMFVASIVITGTLVNIRVTVTTREPSGTLFTTGRYIADSVAVTTVAISLAVLAPCTTQTC